MIRPEDEALPAELGESFRDIGRAKVRAIRSNDNDLLVAEPRDLLGRRFQSLREIFSALRMALESRKSSRLFRSEEMKIGVQL